MDRSIVRRLVAFALCATLAACGSQSPDSPGKREQPTGGPTGSAATANTPSITPTIASATSVPAVGQPAPPGTTSPGPVGGVAATGSGDASGSSGSDDSTVEGPGPATAGSGIGAVGPPRVFMSMHGSNALADNSANDNQWTYVRANLDGIWGNNVDIDLDSQIRLWRKITTRNVISVDQVPPGATGTFQRFGPNVIPEEQASDIKLNREAIALYTHEPDDWIGDSIAEARTVHASSSMEYPYDKVYTGWGMRNFVALGGASQNADPLTTTAKTALNQGDGAFVECLLTQCTMGGGFTDGATSLIKTMHAQNKPFIFFWSPGESDLATFQSNYNSLKARGLWHRNDIILVMNYGGRFKVAPETINGQPANTITGMLYWALKQQ